MWGGSVKNREFVDTALNFTQRDIVVQLLLFRIGENKQCLSGSSHDREGGQSPGMLPGTQAGGRGHSPRIFQPEMFAVGIA